MKITRRQLRQIIRESISTGDFLRGLRMAFEHDDLEFIGPV